MLSVLNIYIYIYTHTHTHIYINYHKLEILNVCRHKKSWLLGRLSMIFFLMLILFFLAAF